MKAVEWAGKFQAATTDEEVALVLEEYGQETADLIALRSKSSVDKSRLSAMEGAVGEQRNKFRAVVGKVPTLTPDKFEALLDTHAKEYVTLKAKAAVTPPAKPEGKGDNRDGRNFAKKPNNGGGFNNRR